MGGRGSAGGNSRGRVGGGRTPSQVTGKTMTELKSELYERGLVLDSAYNRPASGEEVIMYSTSNENTAYVGTYNRYMDGSREIIDIHRQKS